MNTKRMNDSDKLIFGIRENNNPSINDLKKSQTWKSTDDIMVSERLRAPKLDVTRHRNGNVVAFYNRFDQRTIKQLKKEAKPFTKTLTSFSQLRGLQK